MRKYMNYLCRGTQQRNVKLSNYLEAKFLIPNIHKDQLIRINSNQSRLT